jgi:myo-inositol 2-dehydrogenase/D-chiro-inositol 1-dehydrogenase
MKIALIGCGNIGTLHGTTLAGEDRVSELLVADADPERAAACVARLGSGRPVSVDQAFEASPDAVVIAAATAAHPQLVNRCIELGVPCFCEKPLALEVDDSVALARRAEESGALVQVGFMRRFDPALVKLRGLIAEGALGRVHVLRVASHDHEPPDERYVAGSGGIFRDQLIHDFDMIRWVAGAEVEWVYTAGAIRTLPFLERYGDVDTCAVTLGLDGGALVVLTGTREDGRGEDVRIEAIGSADSASAGLNARTPLLLCDPVGVDTGARPYGGADDRFAEAYRAELAHFLSAAAGEAANPCPPRDFLATLLVATAAAESLAAGTRVSVRQADAAMSAA